MTFWDYKQEKWSRPMPDSQLKANGADGWELAAVLCDASSPLSGAMVGTDFTYIFKREKSHPYE